MNELIHTRYGELEVPEKNDLIARFLRAYGEWAYLETEFLAHNVMPDSRLFDVGAFVGTFSLGAQGWPVRSVIAVDANPAVFAALTANLDRNLHVPHQSVRAAVGTATGRLAVGRYAWEKNLGSLTLREPAIGASPQKETAGVQAGAMVPLESLRSTYGDYDLLKLDIEGGERDALESDARWIARHQPTIWLECNEDILAFRSLEFLFAALYDVHYFAFSSYNPQNVNGNAARIFPVAFEAGLLALPRGTPVALPVPLAEAGCVLARVANEEDLRRQLWLTPRWGVAEWPGLSKTQLLGLCSRFVRKLDYDEFLREGQDDGRDAAQ